MNFNNIIISKLGYWSNKNVSMKTEKIRLSELQTEVN